MKYKVGDEVRVKRTNKETMYKHIEGTTVLILNNVCGDLYEVFDCVGGQWALDEEMLEPVDSKTLRMADGTVIGEFNTGGTISIRDLPSSEWYNPLRLTFKNGSSIEAIPNEDAIRSKEPELVWIDKIASPTATEIKEMVERVRREILNFTNAFPKEEKKMPTKFTFYVTEGTRPDKNPDGDGKGVIPTMTTEVLYKDNDGCANGGSATCDKADYNERQGCLEAIANAVLGGNFDREYEKFLADKKRKYNESCKCKICGRNYYEDEKTGKRTPFTPEDARKHEEWHEQNKKNKRERYLLRKRAKEIAFEEQAQKMAKEIIAENKREAK